MGLNSNPEVEKEHINVIEENTASVHHQEKNGDRHWWNAKTLLGRTSSF